MDRKNVFESNVQASSKRRDKKANSNRYNEYTKSDIQKENKI